MLAFGPDGYLYIGVGDGGGAATIRRTTRRTSIRLLGKILRINVNSGSPYSSPTGNSFCCESVGGRDEIYAFGMRNPWRFSFDRETGQQWVGDVGQSTREEVDTPIRERRQLRMARLRRQLLHSANDPGLCNSVELHFRLCSSTPPLQRTVRRDGRVRLPRDCRNAVPTGHVYLRRLLLGGDSFGWNGVDADHCFSIRRMRISSFGEDEQGELYVVDLNGSVSKIVGSGPPPPPPCTYSINPTRTTWPAAGGTGTVTVTTGSTCPWSATPNAPWLGVTNGTGRIGSGTLNYTVAPYSAKPKKRNGTITIAGQTFNVQQSR